MSLDKEITQVSTNEEILAKIREIFPSALDIRRHPHWGIQMRIPAQYEEAGWLTIHQIPSRVEDLIRRFIRLGGKIDGK